MSFLPNSYPVVEKEVQCEDKDNLVGAKILGFSNHTAGQSCFP